MLQALQGLDSDLQQSVLHQVRDLWTHGSTGLEGNSLNLGETKFVIEEGLTVAGKPLKDHREVVGHARAIGLVYEAVARHDALDEAFLFELHRAVQTEVLIDAFKPTGSWKVEPNGTYAVTIHGTQTFIEYALPADVPPLMRAWLGELARLARSPMSLTEAIGAYARLHLGFVHIHPFCDGNGRMARLLSNIPLLCAGHLPLCIARERRKGYIDLLASYQLSVGRLTSQGGVWPHGTQAGPFTDFCLESYEPTRNLLERAWAQQRSRRT